MQAAPGGPGVLQRLRPSSFAALFLLAVGAILAAVPGWELCYAAWTVLSWLALLLTVFALCWRAQRRAWDRAWDRRGPAALPELAQAGILVVAMAAFWPLQYLSHGVVLADVFSELKAEALARPDDGMPRFAWRETGENGYGHDGFAYDPSGQIVRPRGLRSASWERRVDGTLFASECWSARHVVGSYYWWDNNGCD